MNDFIQKRKNYVKYAMSKICSGRRAVGLAESNIAARCLNHAPPLCYFLLLSASYLFMHKCLVTTTYPWYIIFV